MIKFDPFDKDFIWSYNIQDFQPIYYYTDSIKEAADLYLNYGKTLKKPMNCYYDHETKEVYNCLLIIIKIF